MYSVFWSIVDLFVLHFSQTGGKTNTPAAIKVVYDDVFAASQGDRNAVPNICILVTDGGTNINKQQLATEVENMRNKGRQIGILLVLSTCSDYCIAALSFHMSVWFRTSILAILPSYISGDSAKIIGPIYFGIFSWRDNIVQIMHVCWLFWLRMSWQTTEPK